MDTLKQVWHSSTKWQLLEHALVLGGTLYFLNRLRKVTVSDVIAAVPIAQGVVDQTIKQEVEEAVKGMFPAEFKQHEARLKLPEKGISAEELLKELVKYKSFNAEYERTFAYMYNSELKGHSEVVEKAFLLYMQSNGLNPMAFPALRKFEVEVVNMTLSMLHGYTGCTGTMTSGGTESILVAVKTYRDRARKLTPHIKAPEMVLPISAHPAFAKASALFDVKAVWVPLSADYTVDVKLFTQAVNSNTILLVGSAPQYPHGVVDDITALSYLAIEKKLPLHVDACIGGFILPWVEKLGYSVPRWDFRVSGVTSISADVHKYGFSAKGASTLLFSSEEYRKYQFFSYTDWPGGLFISPSLLGTRNGGCIAAAWASMSSLGQDGYLQLTDVIMKTSRALQDGIAKISPLQVIGKPVMSVVSFLSTDPRVNILCVADVMEDKFKWKMERQHRPDCIHLSLMPPHSKIVDAFLDDLKSSVDHVAKHPELTKSGTAAIYGMVAKVPDKRLIENFLTTFTSRIYQADESPK